MYFMLNVIKNDNKQIIVSVSVCIMLLTMPHTSSNSPRNVITMSLSVNETHPSPLDQRVDFLPPVSSNRIGPVCVCVSLCLFMSALKNKMSL